MMHSALPYSDGLNLTLKELLYYQQQRKSRAVQGMAKGMLAGPYRSLIKGRGMEFDEVRHYQAGDDVRAIDWRVTARTGSTHTKVFKEEKERPVLLLVDFSDSMIFGSQLLLKSVQAAHLAAQLAWQAKQRGDRIGAVIFNQHQHQELRPKGRSSGVLALIHQLQQLHQQQWTEAGGKSRNGGSPQEPKDMRQLQHARLQAQVRLQARLLLRGRVPGQGLAQGQEGVCQVASEEDQGGEEGARQGRQCVRDCCS